MFQGKISERFARSTRIVKFYLTKSQASSIPPLQKKSPVARFPQCQMTFFHEYVDKHWQQS